MRETIIFKSDIEKVRAEYLRKLRELRQREKEALSNLYAAYYFAVDEDERVAIETKILAILEAERSSHNGNQT
ncbi:MAG: hypothetical protein IJ516_06070 [Phascolarctobacterium sp.]|nr:hypothetical protein [Phascolarctobacterium sp.]